MNKQRRAFAKLYPADALILGTPNVWDATLQKARLKIFINGWKACEATLASSKDAENLNAKFDELLALPVGWDSYDGEKINPLAVEKAKELLKYLPKWNWQAVPCSMGNIQLESHTKEHDIDIYIEATKQ